MSKVAIRAGLKRGGALGKDTDMQMKYPYKEKRFDPVHWPKQAVGREEKRVVLPMGRGRPSRVFPLALPEKSGACTLVWNNGFELHVRIEIPPAQATPGDVHATVELGEIHLAALTTDTGKALLVTGRGIRSLKRQRNQHLGKLANKQSHCQKYCRRWKKLQHAQNKQCRRAERRSRDLRHKATRQVIDFCVEERVGTLCIGNPHGVRNRASGRDQNQRLTLWEYGKDSDYLTHPSPYVELHRLRTRTSSRCPSCGHKHKPRNRQWLGKQCGFQGHRDLVGSLTMHLLAFGEQGEFPRSFTYLRPGLTRTRRRRADTPPCCLSESPAQPRIVDTVSSEAGYPGDAAQKPVSL